MSSRIDFGGASPAGGPPAVVVASAHAEAGLKARADLVCTGANDDAVIQAANSRLAASFWGTGDIILLPGDYVFGTAGVALGGGISLRAGSGRGNVVDIDASAVANGTPAIALGSGSLLQGIYAYSVTTGARSEVVRAATRSVIDQCWLWTSGTGNANDVVRVNSSAAHWQIINSYIQSKAGVGLNLNNGFYGTVTGNRIEPNTGTGVKAVSGALYLTIADNSFDASGTSTGYMCWLQSALYSTVVGNVMQPSTSAHGVFLDACANCTVGDNMIRLALDGIRLGASSFCTVNGNAILLPNNNGITLDASSDNTVVGNNIYGAGRATDDTYAGIIVQTTTCDRNNIQANTCRKFTSGNLPKYGVRVAAGVDNWVTNNDLKNSSKTGGNEFSDAGTTTSTTAGNRT